MGITSSILTREAYPIFAHRGQSAHHTHPQHPHCDWLPHRTLLACPIRYHRTIAPSLPTHASQHSPNARTLAASKPGKDSLGTPTQLAVYIISLSTFLLHLSFTSLRTTQAQTRTASYLPQTNSPRLQRTYQNPPTQRNHKNAHPNHHPHRGRRQRRRRRARHHCQAYQPYQPEQDQLQRPRRRRACLSRHGRHRGSLHAPTARPRRLRRS